ncbi:hypothetical protein V6N11_047116 [Hibiscus sabdariffa]|uniref:Uncharacterized protein n=2 Tax=Hibiscus sabdariffa TaxID=183260 RepID=A0ABR2C701_9ROSI
MDAEMNRVCYCGASSTLKTGWTDENPGRRFWGCGNYGKGCGLVNLRVELAVGLALERCHHEHLLGPFQHGLLLLGWASILQCDLVKIELAEGLALERFHHGHLLGEFQLGLLLLGWASILQCDLMKVELAVELALERCHHGQLLGAFQHGLLLLGWASI